jgi:hypothetical protein
MSMSRVSCRAAEVEVHGVTELRSVRPAFEYALRQSFQLRQSPKMALGPVLLGLKQAAEARKCQRIAGRIAALAGGGRARPSRLG